MASEAQAQRQAFVTRRRQFVARLTAAQNRWSGLRGTAQAAVEAPLEGLRERVKQLDAHIAGPIQPCQAWHRKHTRLKRVPGGVQVVAATLLARLPERGQRSAQRIGTLVGVAPLKRDSGQMQGKRTLDGGRAPVRQRLSMATLVAVRHHPVLHAFSHQLRNRGKPTKVALVAWLHKLLTSRNAMLKNGTDWQLPQPPNSQPAVQPA